MRSDRAREDLLAIYQAALDAVNGRHCVARYLRDNEAMINRPVHVIAIGKAAVSMSEGVLDVLGGNIADAFVATKLGYGAPLPWTVYEGGHPLPDESSLEAGVALLNYVQRLSEDAEVLVLLSGGASTIVELLADGVTLAHLLELNENLLTSSLDIAHCNYLRKRLSRLKAGGLAAMLAPRNVRVLAISDVAGDDAAVIGSGPLTPSTNEQQTLLLSPLLSTELSEQLLRPVENNLASSDHVDYVIVANLHMACRAAADKACELGYSVHYNEHELVGDINSEAQKFVHQLLSLEPGTVLLCGGEPVIGLPDQPGRGGRCQHFALLVADSINEKTGYSVLSAATDGSDGPGDDAGALVDADTAARIKQEGLDIKACLATADSAYALDAAGALLSTGPTGTNVRDLFMGIRLE